MNTALNRTTIAYLTNKSGGALTYGAVVVLDNTNASGFTTTTSAGLSTRGIGVILDVAGIANNATGAVAIGGWCPQINLNTASTVGQFIKTHTVAGQGTPHASPQVEGDFAVALTASATPEAMLFGSANGPIGGSGSSVVVQVVNTQTGAVATGTTVIPDDDTIPQNTEGDEYMTLAITPTDTANKLKIDVVFFGGSANNSRWTTCALFQDSTANALAVGREYNTTGTAFNPCVFTHYMTAGTTSSTTFKVRAGPDIPDTMTFNGQGGARKMGGVMASSITITEIVP